MFYSSRTWPVRRAPPDKAVERAPASRGQEAPPSSTCCILVTDATSYKTRHSTFHATKHLPKTDLRSERAYKVQQWATLHAAPAGNTK